MTQKVGFYDQLKIEVSYMKKKDMLALKQFTKRETDKLAIFEWEQRDVWSHQHDCFELAYITEGTAIQTLDGDTIPLKKGAYFIIDHGSIHNYTQCENMKLINCLFLADIIDASLVNCISFDELMRVCMIRFYKQYTGFLPVNHVFYDDDGKILRILMDIMEESGNRSMGYREIYRGKRMEILILTMRKVVQEQDEVPIAQLTDNAIIREAIRYFEANYQKKALLSTFCEKNHYNAQYISRRFKQETGLTASEYLHKIRIKRSCNLLVGSNLTIREISLQAVYEDVKFFNKIFKQTIGITPGEYRKTSRKV